jgi:hypothetical protein
MLNACTRKSFLHRSRPGTSAVGATMPVRAVEANAHVAAAAYLMEVYSQPYKAFVDSQKNGTWSRAEPVPGLAVLDTWHQSEVISVSCASAGNCTAGGFYTGRSGGAFAASQKNGTWGKAGQVPGLAALDTGEDSVLWSVSCGSPGNCSAGGSYAHRSPGNIRAFVVSQHNGTWGNAEPVPGTAALNKGGHAMIRSVSCSPAAAAAPSGTTPTAPATSRCSSSASQADPPAPRAPGGTCTDHPLSQRGVQHIQGPITKGGTRTRRAHSAGPVSTS